MWHPEDTGEQKSEQDLARPSSPNESATPPIVNAQKTKKKKHKKSGGGTTTAVTATETSATLLPTTATSVTSPPAVSLQEAAQTAVPTTNADPSASASNKDSLLQLLETRLKQLERDSELAPDEAAKLDRTLKQKEREVKQSILESAHSSDEKVRRIHAKYLEEIAISRQHEKSMILLKRKIADLTADNRKYATDLDNMTSLQTKLEALCRELQKRIKQAEQDRYQMIADMQADRQALLDRFSTEFGKFNERYKEEVTKREAVMQENQSLHEKITLFVEQFDKIEAVRTQLTGISETQELERQLLEVKLQQQTEIASVEHIQAEKLRSQLEISQMEAQQLQQQLTHYSKQFDDLNTTMSKSSEILAALKTQLTKSNEINAQLKKENAALGTKLLNSEKDKKHMLEQVQLIVQQRDQYRNQRDTLQGLCQALQEERKNLRKEADQLRNSTTDTPSAVESTVAAGLVSSEPAAVTSAAEQPTPTVSAE